jgi:hypothetical protein
MTTGPEKTRSTTAARGGAWYGFSFWFPHRGFRAG